MENNEKTFKDSFISLENRSKLNITGVEKVFETNENKVLLKVSNSNLTVYGEGLNIFKLDVDTGVVSIEGKIDDIKFSHAKDKTNFFKKLFK